MNRSVLSNGLRVVTVPRTQTRLTAVKLLIKIGSRHDGACPGISHFVEHLLLNREAGSSRYVFRTLEGMGGDINAVTHREYTALQAVVLAAHVPLVIKLFEDLLAPLQPSRSHIDLERQVIVQEIERAGDSQTVIWDLFLRALWGDDPLARPIYGSVQSVGDITEADLAAHGLRYRAPSRRVLTAAGAVDHEELVQLAERHLGGAGEPGWVDAFTRDGVGSGRSSLEKDIQTTHLVVGVEAIGLRDPRRPAMKVLDIVLGRGASSRLHRSLRDELGLVYQVSSVAMAYEDRGYLAAYTSCSARGISQVIEVVAGEFERMARKGISEEELAAAQVHYEGALARNFETVLSIASVAGIEELLHRTEPFEESVAAVRKVTRQEVRELAGEIFALDRLTIAMVGRTRIHAHG